MVSKKIAIIGSPDTILPFKAVGVEGIPANDAVEAREKLEQILHEKKYGIIYLEEAFAESFSAEVKRLNEKYRDVSITAIAGSRGSTGNSVEKIRNYVKKAIGIDIFAEKGGK